MDQLRNQLQNLGLAEADKPKPTNGFGCGCRRRTRRFVLFRRGSSADGVGANTNATILPGCVVIGLLTQQHYFGAALYKTCIRRQGKCMIPTVTLPFLLLCRRSTVRVQ